MEQDRATALLHDAVWTPTPVSLRRLGLVDAGRVATGWNAPGETQATAMAIEAARRWLEAQGGTGFRAFAEELAKVPLAPQTPGDMLLAIWADGLGQGARASRRMGALLVKLQAKNFLLSVAEVGPHGPLTCAQALAAISGLRLQTDRRALGLYRDQGPAVIVSCAAIAHIALANFVERKSGLKAEAFGRVTLPQDARQ